MTLKKIISATILFACLAFANPSIAQRDVKDASTKTAIAGKTYQGWSKGKFDSYTNADAAAYFIFDANSNGTCRQFFIYQPDLKTAETHQLLVKYMEVGGKPVLAFSHTNGVDAGTAYITSYNNGTKVWAESVDPNRPMKGWMLMVPPAVVK
jgi:hypothetical protein